MRPSICRRGLTLIELLVGVAIIAILLALGVPSMREWMINQRVSATASEVMTDMQFARSEAVKRNTFATMVFNNGGNCYTIQAALTGIGACNCTQPSGSRCPQGFIELKTMSPEAGVTVSSTGNATFTNLTSLALPFSAARTITVDDGTAAHRVILCAGSGVHRPSMCKPAGSKVSGIPACGVPAC